MKTIIKIEHFRDDLGIEIRVESGGYVIYAQIQGGGPSYWQLMEGNYKTLNDAMEEVANIIKFNCDCEFYE